MVLVIIFTSERVEAADRGSIAELAAARRLTRTTDKDILANEDNSAGPSYRFVPVSLSNLAVKPQTENTRHEPVFYPHTYNTGALLRFSLRWMCEISSFSASNDLSKELFFFFSSSSSSSSFFLFISCLYFPFPSVFFLFSCKSGSLKRL